MRYQLPEHWTVRYDYHEHPRGISAIVQDQNGTIQGVGVAKFNPADPQFKASTGKSIALGRALARHARGIGRGPYLAFPRGDRVVIERFGASLADELVRTD